MSNVWWVMRRELGTYLRSPMGYIIIFFNFIFRMSW